MQEKNMYKCINGTKQKRNVERKLVNFIKQGPQ